jgi:hypothetical protein
MTFRSLLMFNSAKTTITMSVELILLFFLLLDARASSHPFPTDVVET